MNLNLSINNQSLTRLNYDIIVANSQEYLYCKFNFSEDWDETSNKHAIFSNPLVFDDDNKVKVIDILIKNNECCVPSEILSKDGFFTINVKGTNGSLIITTNPIKIILDNSGYDDGVDPNTPIPSALTKALELAQKSYSDFKYSITGNVISITMIDNNGLEYTKKVTISVDASDYYTKEETDSKLDALDKKDFELEKSLSDIADVWGDI